MNASMSDALSTALMSFATAAIPIIGYFATAALQKFAKKHGKEIDEKNLQRIDQFLVNGLNFAATNAGGLRNLPRGVSAKDYIAQGAMSYLKDHGAETLNEMSANLNDPKVQEAIRARIETLIADPTKPTPPLLSPEKPSTVVAPVVSPT